MERKTQGFWFAFGEFRWHLATMWGLFVFAGWFFCVVAVFVSGTSQVLAVSFWFGVVPIRPHWGSGVAHSSKDSPQLGLSHRRPGCRISSPSSLRGFRSRMV